MVTEPGSGGIGVGQRNPAAWIVGSDGRPSGPVSVVGPRICAGLARRITTAPKENRHEDESEDEHELPQAHEIHAAYVHLAGHRVNGIARGNSREARIFGLSACPEATGSVGSWLIPTQS
jgi:hypothetical protein